jgi:hypothetical protein
VNPFPIATVISFSKFALAAGVVALAACGSDNGTGPSDTTPRVTVDATGGTAYLALGTPATVVSVPSPTTSSAWDLGFNALSVSVNGGASGLGNVSAYCICQNQTKTDAQILALTAQDALDDFDAVTETDIPDEASFEEDVQALAISGWYNYDMDSHAITANPAAVWSVRLASTSGAYAKFHVTSIAATGMSTGDIGIEWAVQPNGSTTVDADQTLTVSTSTTMTYVNLTDGTTASGTAPAHWDIAFQGFKIFLNNDGNAAAISLTETNPIATYDSFTSATIIGGTALPPQVFEQDGTGGVFATTPWYRYDIDPVNEHQVTPTYDVYLVKKGSTVYKVQIISYYGKGGDNSGTARHIVVRYAALDSAN